MSHDVMPDPVLAEHIAEADAVFGRGWVCAGHTAMLAKAGDYVTIDLVGNLLVAVRAQDRIRVLSRVCLHRWASLIEGAGNVRRFTCPFHAWSYALDGRLIGAAFMEKAEGFDRTACRLPEIPAVFDASGLIFISLSAPDRHPSPLPFDVTEGLGSSVAEGPPQDTVVPLGWTAIMDQAVTSSPGAYAAGPNALLRRGTQTATLQLLFPNGPNATLVRTIELIVQAPQAITGEAPSADLPK